MSLSFCLPWVAKLASLHLDLAVVFIVVLLCRRDQIQHVRSDQQASQLFEITVIVVFYFCNTPRVLAALDSAAISSKDILCRSNDREGHGSHDVDVALGRGFVVALNGRRIALDVLSRDNISNLQREWFKG